MKESNPTLICKKSKKPRMFDPCKGKMCWHRKGPGDSAMYYFSIKSAKKNNSYAKNKKTGGAYKSKKLKKSRNNDKYIACKKKIHKTFSLNLVFRK